MCILFVYGGQVVSNPGVDRGLKFLVYLKPFSLPIFRGVRTCKSSSKLEKKKDMLKVHKTDIKIKWQSL